MPRRISVVTPIASLRRFLVGAFLALLGVVAPASGADGVELGAAAHKLPLTIVDGIPVVSIKLTNPEGLVDAITVELALDHPGTLTLDGNQFGWLGVNPKSSPPVKVALEDNATVLFPAAGISAERSGARQELHDRITQLHASKLKDRKLKGRLGIEFLRHYHVVLDPTQNFVELTPLADAPQPASITSDYAARFDAKTGLISLPVELPSGRSQLVIGSSSYDTRIDPAVAEKLGRPDGNIERVELPGSVPLNLAKFVVFRPADWREKKTDQPDVAVVTGVNLLESFRVEIHWLASQIFFSAVKPSTPNAADRDYFMAERADTAEAYLAVLKKHPENRLAAEAARKLARLRMDEWGAADDDVLEAIEWVAKTAAADRRTEACMPYIRALASQVGRTELTIRAAKQALTHARGAITVQDVYRIHRILGEQYIDLNDLDQAWRHLMSAAFVKIDRDPEHAFYVAYNLARVYEKQGRTSRAYSRYRAALAVNFAISKEMKDAIEKSIATLKAQIPPADLQLLDG
jgi:tetratricopeptide (TPR) repeat protein